MQSEYDKFNEDCNELYAKSRPKKPEQPKELSRIEVFVVLGIIALLLISSMVIAISYIPHTIKQVNNTIIKDTNITIQNIPIYDITQEYNNVCMPQAVSPGATSCWTDGCGNYFFGRMNITAYQYKTGCEELRTVTEI